MTITATILADSITPEGKRITSFELEYPRYIHAEVMTHRMFSRNAASSRAIPVSKVIKQVYTNPATPLFWGSTKPGMQAGAELSGFDLAQAKVVWSNAADSAAEESENLFNLGLHKQHANRITEPFQQYKVVLTATEFDNFFHLRCHPDAQPEIRMLAEAMYKTMQDSTPMKLYANEYHLPYIVTTRSSKGTIEYRTTSNEFLSLAEAIKVSSSCCAQVSYRILDDSIDKAISIYDRLVESEPVHASPFEHQATPMDTYDSLLITSNTVEGGYPEPYTDFTYDWQPGVTHMDSKCNLWSGNFQGWIQHRQLIKNNVATSYTP